MGQKSANSVRHFVLRRHVSKFETDFRCSSEKYFLISGHHDLIRVYTVCHSVCIFWTYSSVVKLFCLNFRGITENFSGHSEFLRYTMGMSGTGMYN